MWSSERPRRLAFLTLAVTLSACATEPAPQPAAAGVCPLRAGAWPSQIDVFDGDPSEQVILAPDDDKAGANTYTVTEVYAQGRTVTIRCHYGKEHVDQPLRKPVQACHYAGDDKHPRMTCR